MVMTDLNFILDLETGQKLVPIFTSTREWTRGTVQCKRTQFPLHVAYAITIHKGQGISVDCAVLNLSGEDDFSPGLTYVAILSRSVTPRPPIRGAFQLSTH